MPQAHEEAFFPTTAEFEQKAETFLADFNDEVQGRFRAKEFDSAAEKMLRGFLGGVLRHRLIFRAQATTLVNQFHSILAHAARERLTGALIRRGVSRKHIQNKLRAHASKKVDCGVDSFGCDGVRVRGQSNVDIALFWGPKCLWIWEDKFSVDSTNKNNGTGVMDRVGEAEALRENNTHARISSVGIHPEVSHRIETRHGVAHCELETVVAKGLARSSNLRAQNQNIFLRDFWFEIDPRILACKTRPERCQMAVDKPNVARARKMNRLARMIWAAVKSDLQFASDSILRFEEGGGWREANPAFEGMPRKDEIKTRRMEAKLSPAEAAKLLNGCDAKMWVAYERGFLPMAADTWTVFKLRTRKSELPRAKARKRSTPMPNSTFAPRGAAKAKLAKRAATGKRAVGVF